MTINEAIKTIIEQNRQLVKLFNNVNLDVENYDDTEVRELIKTNLDSIEHINNVIKSNSFDTTGINSIDDIKKCMSGSMSSIKSTWQYLNMLGTSYSNLLSLATTVKTFIESTDTADTTINTWREIEQFLAGIKDNESLLSIINDLNSKINEVDGKFDEYNVKDVDNTTLKIDENGVVSVKFLLNKIEGARGTNITNVAPYLSSVRTYFDIQGNHLVCDNRIYIYNAARDIVSDSINLVTEKGLYHHLEDINDTYKIKNVDGITLVKDDEGIVSLNYDREPRGSILNSITKQSPIYNRQAVEANKFVTRSNTHIYNGDRDINSEATNLVTEKALYKHLTEIGNPRVFDLITDNIAAIKEYYENNGLDNLFVRYNKYNRIYELKVIGFNVENNRLYTESYLEYNNGVNYIVLIDFNNNTIIQNAVNLQGKNIIDNTITANKLADDVLPKIKVFNLVQGADNSEIFDYVANHDIETNEVYVRVHWTNNNNNIYSVKIIKASANNTELYTDDFICNGELKYVIIRANSYYVQHAYYNLNSISQNSIGKEKLKDEVANYIPTIKFFNVDSNSDNTELFNYVAEHEPESVVIIYNYNEGINNKIYITSICSVYSNLIKTHPQLNSLANSCYIVEISKNTAKLVSLPINATAIKNNTITLNKLATEVTEKLGGTIEDGSITKDKLSIALQGMLDSINSSTVININDTSILGITDNGQTVDSNLHNIVKTAKNLKIRYGTTGELYLNIKTIDIFRELINGVIIIAEKVDVNTFESKYYKINIVSSKMDCTVTVVSPASKSSDSVAIITNLTLREDGNSFDVDNKQELIDNCNYEVDTQTHNAYFINFERPVIAKYNNKYYPVAINGILTINTATGVAPKKYQFNYYGNFTEYEEPPVE